MTNMGHGTDGRGPPKTSRRIVLRLPLLMILQAALLFVSAGRIDLPRIWVYVGAASAYSLVYTFLMCRHNPELIAERARGVRADTKSWDKILMPAIVVVGYVQLVVIGLDVGRFGWATLNTCFGVAGLVIGAFISSLSFWTIMMNPYFEPTVRIQIERGHHTIMTGPYRIVRHPGYVVAILSPFAVALITGSSLGLIPAAISAILLVIRTSLEDNALQNELPGYRAYALRVRYRLLPGVW